MTRSSPTLRYSDPCEESLQMHTQSCVECLNGCVLFQLGKAGDVILAVPTGHDARKMGQIGSDVDGKAVQRHPSAYAYANGADFGLTSIWSIGPDTDASLGSPCSYAEFTESGNDPIDRKSTRLNSSH